MVSKLTYNEMEQRLAFMEKSLSKSKNENEKRLEDSDNRYHTLFEEVPISIWEEDYFALKSHINYLRQSGVKNFEHYLNENKQEVAYWASLVKIVDMNQASLDLYQIKNKKNFSRG